MLESHISVAKCAKPMSDVILRRIRGAHRVVRQVRSLSTSDAAIRLLDLYQRHACDVGEVIVKGIAAHANEIEDGSVPGTCLLILALPEKYKRPAKFAARIRPPFTCRDYEQVTRPKGERNLHRKLSGLYG